MNDDAPGGLDVGTCSECGRALPAGTMRYCVHCGAEVAGDHRSRHAGVPAGARGPAGVERPGSTWATGEFRAPSPLDGVPELPSVLPPALPPAPGDAWYSDAWYAEEPAPTEPDPPKSASVEPAPSQSVPPDSVPPDSVPPDAVPPAPAPHEPAFQVGDDAFDGDDRPTALVWPPTGASPAPLPPVPPTVPAPAADAEWPPQQVWPGAPQQMVEPPVLPLGDAAPLGWSPQAASVPPDGRSGRIPVLPVAAAALVLVVITTFGLLWLNSRGSAEVTASQVASSGTTPSGTAAPAGTVGSAADVTPSADPGGVSPSGSDPDSTADATVSGTASAGATSADVTDAAAALDALLDESETARGEVASTAVNLQSCRVAAGQAASTFRRAGDERARLASEATALPVAAVAAVPGVGDAVRAFIALQRASAQADDAFADWAGEVQVAGCPGQARHTANWDLANRYSGEASSAKARFVRLWNPIAARQGLRARSADAI